DAVRAAAPAASPADECEHAAKVAATIAARHRPEHDAALFMDRTAESAAYGTIVICEACTSKGLNSPVRPCGSFAVTVYRTIPIGASSGTIHFATQNSRSGCRSFCRSRIGTSTDLPA